jgi:predicted AAA+ superfamily ATPase
VFNFEPDYPDFLREILAAIIKRYGSQITWNALAQDLSIDHPKTVSDYIALLESMDAVFVQSALLEDKLIAAPKKARKVMFNDPTDSSKFVESCVAAHYHRFYPTYYIKAEGEVDVAYVHNNRFWPIEIKWTSQLRPKNLKQIMKYSNSRIFTKTKQHGII